MSYHEVPLVVTDAMVTMMEANLNNIKTAIGTFEITEDDLKLIPSMGPRRYVFSIEAHRIAKQFPNILFHNRGVASYDLVKSNYEKLAPVYTKFNVLFQSFKTIMRVLGSNTYAHGLSTYEAINLTNNNGIQGIEFARKTLFAFFKGQGVQVEPEEDPDGPFVPGNEAPTNGGPSSGGGNG